MRLALILTAALAASPALAQDARPPAYANAEACLRENAPAAVRASSGAADAAEFLLQYLCAGPVHAASAYERNSTALAAFQTLMGAYGGDEADYTADVGVAVELIDPTGEGPATSAMSEAPVLPNMGDPLDGVSVDPITGEFVAEPGSTGGAMIGVMSMQGGGIGGPAGGAPAIFLRELAGRLVMELRR